MKAKPRLFIASSVEGLAVADAVNVNLDHELEVTVWKNAFRLSTSTIDDLVKKSSAVDFALFIFTPDDVATIRGKTEPVVRDNVLFELGLFIGALGKERCFILRPRTAELHLPTDLLGGMNAADYEPNRSDGDFPSAVNRACTLIKKEIADRGILADVVDTSRQRLVVNPENFKLSHDDLCILSWAAGSHIDSPGGLRFSGLESAHRKMGEHARRIGAIKLERMGFIDRSIEVDNEHGYEYFAYRITENGISMLLKNEELLRQKSPERPEPSIGGFEDDIPF